MSIQNISVTKKLILAFGVTVFVVLAMCFTVNMAMGRQAVLERNNSESDDVMTRLERARGDIFKGSADVRRYMLTGAEADRPNIDATYAAFEGELKEVRHLTQRAPE